MEKRFTEGGITIVFFQKENDSKYSFLVENEPELTEKLNQSVKTKRVDESGIRYAVPALFEKIAEIMDSDFDLYESVVRKIQSNNCENPIVVLAELCQKMFGKNIESKVIGKIGQDHCPTITVNVLLPNGTSFKASGSNQKEARKIASISAIDYLRGL